MIAAIAVWVVGGLAVALVVGRAIRIADEREARVLPARLDPRAGQHAAKAAHGTFTALLVALAVVALGLAQQFAAGGAL